MLITETWITDENSVRISNELSFNGRFKVFLTNRDSTKKTRGGGCAILVDSDIAYKILPSSSENGYEFACVKLLLKRSVTIFCAYRPGDCPLTATKSLLRRAESSVCEQFLLCGDLNLPSIDWNALSASDAPGRRLLDFSFQNNLT